MVPKCLILLDSLFMTLFYNPTPNGTFPLQLINHQDQESLNNLQH